MMGAKNTAHLAERFFLDNFEFHLDHVFHRIQRADYLVLYSIQARQDAPGRRSISRTWQKAWACR